MTLQMQASLPAQAAPLDVPAVVGLHRVEDEVRSRTTVVDVAEDMQLVDSQAVYHVADGDDEVVGAPRGDDGVDDGANVGGLVHILGVLVQ